MGKEFATEEGEVMKGQDYSRIDYSRDGESRVSDFMRNSRLSRASQEGRTRLKGCKTPSAEGNQVFIV